MLTQFKNFQEFVNHYSDEKECRKHLKEQRWKNGVKCIHCGSEKVYIFKDGIRYKCSNKDCLKKFTITVGTIFENSKIPLTKWFLAIYLSLYHKKGISSVQLSKDLGITQKSAWFVLHRIREMAKEKDRLVLSNIVEVDETYVGGKNKNRNYAKKVKYSQGRSYKDKTPVFGLLERGGKVISMKVPDVKASTLKEIIYSYCGSQETIIMSDEWKAYKGLNKYYQHGVVDHGRKQFVDGMNYTNTIEGYWSHMKRTIVGTYHWISRKHTNRYCHEFDFRYNTRKLTIEEQFDLAINRCGARLKYKTLIQDRYVSIFKAAA